MKLSANLFLHRSFLVCRNATDFCMLIFFILKCHWIYLFILVAVQSLQGFLYIRSYHFKTVTIYYYLFYLCALYFFRHAQGLSNILLCNPMQCTLPGSSHGIFTARILEWVAISYSRVSSWPRDQTHISYIGRWIRYHWPSLSCLIALKRASSTMLNKSGDNVHHCLVPGLTGKAFSYSLLNMMLPVVFFKFGLYQIGKIVFCFWLLSFYNERGLNFAK